MYLRSLELLGFKSFARKTEIVFPRGVAAIVGPNGCGKSNVLDAVRWVLGEQSAKALRGAEMADVIFNGNDVLRALGMAEVSLTFAECEAELGTAFHEVRVTRRVYRDGGSEYLLNQTSCRLRDIQQLFMDTGIGRSAYSVMEQGKIDQILSSRPEDRRAIFEEAAGITKYKTQRRDALRKLELTGANLARLTDVLGEVRRQLGGLQRQAAKARRFQSLHADLRTLETHLASEQFGRWERELTQARAEADRAQAGLEATGRELADDESVLAYRRAQLERQEGLLEAARARVADAGSRLVHAESRLEFNRERLGESQHRLARYEAERAAAEEQLHLARTELEGATAQEQDAREQLADDQRQERAGEERLRALRGRRTQAEALAAAAARRVGEAGARLEAARGELGRTRRELEAAGARRELLGRELESLAPALAEAAERLAAARAELARAEQTARSHQDRARQADAAAAAAQRAWAGLDGEERAAQKQLTERTSRLEALRQLAAEGEGFAAGTRAALRGGDRDGVDPARVLGVIGGLVEVAPAYIPAVEAVLGTNLQAVVVADEPAAVRILELLSARALGRAHLAVAASAAGDGAPASAAASAPADDPDPGQDPDLAPGPGSGPGLAAGEPAGGAPPPAAALPQPLLALVTAPAALRPLLRRLLGETTLVEDLAAARAWRRDHPAGAAVTLAGECLFREGIWAGGRGGNERTGQSILERRARLGALAREVEAARQTWQEVAARREQTQRGHDAAIEEARQAREAWRAAQTELFTLQAEVGPLEREERSLAGRRGSFERERDDFERRWQLVHARAGLLETEIDEQTAAQERAAAERQQLQADLEGLRQEEHAANEELTTLRVRVAAGQQRHAGLARERQPLLARCRELGALIEQRRREGADYQARLTRAAEENAGLETTIEATRRQLGEAEEQVRALAAERAATQTETERLDHAARERRQQLGRWQEQRAQAELRAEQLRLRQENLGEQLTRRYQVDLRLFQPQPALFAEAFARREQDPAATAARAGEDPGAPGPGADALPVNLAPAIPAAAAADLPPPVLGAVAALVERLRERLDAIGTVNLEAIAEYDALEERHRFLQGQEADLRTAEAELRAIITRVNATSRALFTETFALVRTHFGEMFRELFGGGRADLHLADEGDPLECGIEITARPPGKPAQSISLLSGGEKTMTAVALLFAVYLVKPSPFCVLDEMDAPLDESNVARFVRLLDRFSQQSQFVVITHNKRTMARADALFGVTMEEPGVSKLVAVRLARPAVDADADAGAPPAPAPAAPAANGHHPETLPAVAAHGGVSLAAARVE